MNRIHYEPLSVYAPYLCQPQTVRRPIVPSSVRISRKLTKRLGKNPAEKPISAAITMITEAEEWARRALAAQGYGNG